MIAEFNSIRGMYTPNEILQYVYPVDSELANVRSKIPRADPLSTATKSASESESESDRRTLRIDQERVSELEKEKEREEAACKAVLRTVGILGESDSESRRNNT